MRTRTTVLLIKRKRGLSTSYLFPNSSVFQYPLCYITFEGKIAISKKRKKFVFFIKMASFQKLIIQEERANALLAQEEHFVKTSKFWKSNSSFKFCNVRAILNCLPTSFPKSFFFGTTKCINKVCKEGCNL